MRADTRLQNSRSTCPDLMRGLQVLWNKQAFLQTHATNKIHLFTLQLAVGHQRAAESHAPDVGAQIGHRLQHTGGRVAVKVGELNHVLCNAGEDGRQTHKTVEGRHQLWQVGDFNALSDGETCRRYLNRKKTKNRSAWGGHKRSQHIWLE